MFCVLSNTIDQAKLSINISLRLGSPKACVAIAAEWGVVLASLVEQKLREFSQTCLNKLAYQDNLLCEILAWC